MKKLKITLILFILAITTVFTGCKIGMQSWEDFKETEGLVSSVAYYTNGGTFNGVIGETYKEMWLKENEKALNIGVVNSTLTVTYPDMVFLGWYLADLDADGKIQYDDQEKSIIKTTDNKFDFTQPLAKNTHVVLGAKWTEDVKIEFYLASDFAITTESGDVKKKGDLIGYKTFGADPTLSGVNKVTPCKATDATYLKMYLDEGCLNPVTDDHVFNKPTSSQENIPVYVEYIQGVWTLVSSQKDAKAMLSGMGTTKSYYLLNDIDLDGANISTNNVTKCKIEGNGFKISNFNFTVSNLANSSTKSIFGKLYGTANIRNLTLEEIEFNLSVRNDAKVSIFALFSSVNDAGATFENFIIDGLTMNVTMPTSSMIFNIQNIGGSYKNDNWLYGGFNTDSEFTAIYSGISVTNSNFVINN